MRNFIFIFFLVFSIKSYSEDIKGSCWDEAGNNQFFASMANASFRSYKAGSESYFSLSGLPSSYRVKCWVPNGPVDPGRYIKYIVYTDLVQSENSNSYTKYFRLTDDVDVNIDIDNIPRFPGRELVWIDDFPSELRPAGGIYYTDKSPGLSVKINAKLRRDQIGGFLHIPAGIQLFRMYANIEVGASMPDIEMNTKILTMSTSEQFIPLPVVCKINNNAEINVDFGDIDNTNITQNGSSYIKTIPLKYSCNTSINQDIDIHVVASPASFSSDFIATSIPDSIGILMKYNGQVIKPNGKFRTVLINGMGQDELQVAPVINDPKKSVTGDFTASATLVMTIL